MSSEQEQPEPKPEPEPKPKPKSGGRVQGLLTALGVLGANLALTVLFYWDALASAGRRVVGAENTETWTFLWGHFWMAQSITEEGRLPLKTDLLAFPQGGTLWLKDPLWALALLPLIRDMGPYLEDKLEARPRYGAIVGLDLMLPQLLDDLGLPWALPTRNRTPSE